MVSNTRNVQAEARARAAIGRHGLTVDHVFQGGSERFRDPEVWTEREAIERRYSMLRVMLEGPQPIGIGGGVGAELPNGNRLTTAGFAGWSAFKFTCLNWGYSRSPSGAVARLRQGFQNMNPEDNRNGLSWVENVEVQWVQHGPWIRYVEAPSYPEYLAEMHRRAVAKADRTGQKVTVLQPKANPDYVEGCKRRGHFNTVKEWKGGTVTHHEKHEPRKSTGRGGKGRNRGTSNSNRVNGNRESVVSNDDGQGQTKGGRNGPQAGRNNHNRSRRRGSSTRGGRRARPAGPKSPDHATHPQGNGSTSPDKSSKA